QTGAGAASVVTTESTGQAVAGGTITPSTVQPVPSAPTPAVPPGGHAAAPASMAACPDAPGKNLVVLACMKPPVAVPPAVEQPELPKPDAARYGGDADREKFAKELAQCHAARVVN